MQTTGREAQTPSTVPKSVSEHFNFQRNPKWEKEKEQPLTPEVEGDKVVAEGLGTSTSPTSCFLEQAT